MTVNHPAAGSSSSRKRRPTGSMRAERAGAGESGSASGGTPTPSRGAKWRRAMLTLITATADRVSASAAVKLRPRTAATPSASR